MWQKWKRYIAESLSAFDSCTVVSDPEIAPLRDCAPGYKNIQVIPNGADLSRLTGDFGAPDADTLVYTGAMTYHVNFDAMKFFLTEVYPLILAARPRTRLLMAGRYDGVPIHELPKYDSVKYLGHLADIRPCVSQSWLSVVPERIGGGTRIKILESMALGTPVVTTSRGATGLLAENGRDILVADEPQAFCDAVIRVLDEPDLRASLSQRGRRMIERQYDWSVIGAIFNAYVSQIVEGRAKKQR